MTVTNGVFKFEQRINDGDFQHRVASAEITFTTDGSDVHLVSPSIRFSKAVDQVRRSLASTMGPVEPDSQIILPSAQTVSMLATTSNMEQRHAMPESDQIGAGEKGPFPKPRKGRKSVTDPTPTEASSAPAETPQTATVDTGANSTPLNGAPTDEMLQSACQARMARGMEEQDLEVANKIRALVASHVGEPGKKAADIPQEKRLAFLAELLA